MVFNKYTMRRERWQQKNPLPAGQGNAQGASVAVQRSDSKWVEKGSAHYRRKEQLCRLTAEDEYDNSGGFCRMDITKSAAAIIDFTVAGFTYFALNCSQTREKPILIYFRKK